jgi:hypothetical protein
LGNSRFAGHASSNRRLPTFKRPANDSPSPGGEGRREGGRARQNIQHNITRSPISTRLQPGVHDGVTPKPFQRFATRAEKPLKRFLHPVRTRHLAEARR